MFTSWRQVFPTWVHKFLSWKHKIHRYEKTNLQAGENKSVGANKKKSPKHEPRGLEISEVSLKIIFKFEFWGNNTWRNCIW